MRLSTFEISNLFGQWNHKIDFPFPNEDNPKPSLVILHGPNGVGKTTILRMIDGIMQLDFNIFRIMPFRNCSLSFSTNKKIQVKPNRIDPPHILNVKFDRLEVTLHPSQAGPLQEEDFEKVVRFRDYFFKETKDLRFELIDINRLSDREDREEFQKHQIVLPFSRHAQDERLIERVVISRGAGQESKRIISPKGGIRFPYGKLSKRVLNFLKEAQVNYRSFFASTEPDMFNRIIQHITINEEEKSDSNTLLKRLKKINFQDKITTRLGLERDKWDFNKLKTLLKEAEDSTQRIYILAVIGAYVEVLEARAAERWAISQRLLKFEDIMKKFIHDKTISIDSENGLIIKDYRNIELTESQLSSGEYHLLYLMVSALVTRVIGTVIAIDEPELSMHISWQRKLIKSLFDCASGAEPQFIFATHSPDIAGEYTNAMIRLGGPLL
jgi:energy-coupling factor transporter ATP-binding protein EcfA2